MRSLFFWAFLLTYSLLSAADVDLAKPIAEIRLTNGDVLTSVQFVSFGKNTATARWKGGMGTIKYALLPGPIAAAVNRKLAEQKDTSSPSEQAKPTQAPDITIATSDNEIEITNLSTASWPEMDIRLNDVTDGFRYRGAAPAIGSKVRISLTRFVSKKGERYNPQLHGVAKVWIGGSGRDYQLFRVN